MQLGAASLPAVQAKLTEIGNYILGLQQQQQQPQPQQQEEGHRPRPRNTIMQ